MDFKSHKLNPSNWPINNRTSIYVLTIIITLMGIMAYNKLPKENFPEIKLPQIIVQTIYPGTSPENMENLVTKPIEKQVKNLTGIKKVTSNSFQDYSIVVVEFNTDVEVKQAKQDVKDAVDKAKVDLPTNLPNDPEVMDIDLSELPILYVNISGNYDLDRLKKYADDMKDRIEGLKEIKRVDMVGAPEREIQIDVNMFKMGIAGISFRDIESAVGYENISLTSGLVEMGKEKRQISIKKEFKTAEEIGNIIIKNQNGGSIYLREIADVKDSYKEQESYARLNGKNVITLNIIKASGENLIDASDKVQKIAEDLRKNEYPKELSVVITGDQSDATRTTLHDLINTIIIGFLLVTIILMFFMGVTNALFVAMSVPLSCFIAFLVMPSLGFTMNMIVLFSFLLALGIVVDDAIVVIENTHRIFNNGKVPIKAAAQEATAEVFIPVLAGTLTTLMPFVPLAFWKGVIGEFMFYLPITLIITLVASLLVAYIINPVFAVDFMKTHDEAHKNAGKWTRGTSIVSVIFGALALIFYVAQSWGMGNFIVFIYLIYLFNKFVIYKWVEGFQNKVWPKVQDAYVRLLDWNLKRPVMVLIGIIVLFFVSIIFVGIRGPKVVFFPSAEPNFVYVYLNLPVGTDQAYTNKVLKELEGKVYGALDIDLKKNKYNPIVSSVIANVAVGAIDPNSGEMGTFPNKGKVTVAFVKFADRKGESSAKYLDKIRAAVKGFPGAEITVDKESDGPPVPKPIVIEITGDNLDSLISTSEQLKRYLVKKQIGGVEELRSDFQSNKPEIIFDLDRERMNREGISTGQIAGDLRTALFGKEVSRFRDANDDYPITLRMDKDQRQNIDLVKNMEITYRDMGMGGQIRQVPISAFADLKYSNTYGGIKRKDQKRIISLTSNVLSTHNPNEVVATIDRTIKTEFKAPAGISIRMGGEQEEQQETMSFLGNAMLAAIGLIFLILVTQFNSVGKTVIILSEIIFSIIGVMLGIGIFKMDISIVMTGVGIVALAGIVVRNGILLVEFTDLMLDDGMPVYEALLEAGRTRMTPVLLTATATMLGLIPLAVGLNIDFARLFSELNPHIYFGGDSVAFWGPLSWTMIFGLSFATFLTLILVPVMYLLYYRLKMKLFGKKQKK